MPGVWPRWPSLPVHRARARQVGAAAWSMSIRTLGGHVDVRSHGRDHRDDVFVKRPELVEQIAGPGPVRKAGHRQVIAALGVGDMPGHLAQRPPAGESGRTRLGSSWSSSSGWERAKAVAWSDRGEDRQSRPLSPSEAGSWSSRNARSSSRICSATVTSDPIRTARSANAEASLTPWPQTPVIEVEDPRRGSTVESHAHVVLDERPRLAKSTTATRRRPLPNVQDDGRGRRAAVGAVARSLTGRTWPPRFERSGFRHPSGGVLTGPVV